MTPAAIPSRTTTGGEVDATAVLADLTRVKALFQARAVAAAMGLPATPTFPASGQGGAMSRTLRPATLL